MNSREEERVLLTLACICVQYIGGYSNGEYLPLDHSCMGAGERAVNVLKDYGLLEPSDRGGTWTEKGLTLLSGRFAEVFPKQVIFMNTREEERVLHALASMCLQYIGDYAHQRLDHRCEKASEKAVRVLVDYGFVEPDGRGGNWTRKGLALLRMPY